MPGLRFRMQFRMERDVVFHCKDGLYRGSSSLLVAASTFFRDILTIKNNTPDCSVLDASEFSIPHLRTYQVDMLFMVLSGRSVVGSRECISAFKEAINFLRIDVFSPEDLSFHPVNECDRTCKPPTLQTLERTLRTLANFTFPEEINYKEKEKKCTDEKRGKEKLSNDGAKNYEGERNGIKHVDKGLNLKCGICEKSFSRHDSLKDHIMIVHDGQRLNCQQCDMSFGSRSGLREHEQVKHEEKSLKCKVCNKIFNRISSLKDHIMFVHDGKKLNCQQCDMSFGSRSGLRVHNQNVHEGRTFKCEHCAETFQSNGRKWHHERTMHNDQLTSTEQKTKKGASIECKLCEISFHYQEGLREHMQSQHKETFFPCNSCNKTFTSLHSVKRHADDVHDEKTYDCTKCSKVFQSPRYLKRHERKIHKGEPSATHNKLTDQSVKIQNKIKIRSSGLEQNNETNKNEEKVFKCTQCCKVFQSISGLHKHKETIHRGKTYACDQCDLTFRSRTGMRDHKRSIHEGKRYSCNQCEKVFHQWCSLKYHMKKIHELPVVEAKVTMPTSKCTENNANKEPMVTYPCVECDEEFTTSSNFKKHMESHGIDVQNGGFSKKKKQTTLRDEPSEKSEYEKVRDRNIRERKQMLVALGLQSIKGKLKHNNNSKRERVFKKPYPPEAKSEVEMRRSERCIREQVDYRDLEDSSFPSAKRIKLNTTNTATATRMDVENNPVNSFTRSDTTTGEKTRSEQEIEDEDEDGDDEEGDDCQMSLGVVIHLNTHKEHKCDVCAQSFSLETSLRKHMLVRHSKTKPVKEVWKLNY